MDERREAMDSETIPDDGHRLVFSCCHPGLPADSRVVLILRLVGLLASDKVCFKPEASRFR